MSSTTHTSTRIATAADDARIKRNPAANQTGRRTDDRHRETIRRGSKPRNYLAA